jgi:hypothetical protein
MELTDIVKVAVVVAGISAVYLNKEGYEKARHWLLQYQGPEARYEKGLQSNIVGVLGAVKYYVEYPGRKLASFMYRPNESKK